MQRQELMGQGCHYESPQQSRKPRRSGASLSPLSEFCSRLLLQRGPPGTALNSQVLTRSQNCQPHSLTCSDKSNPLGFFHPSDWRRVEFKRFSFSCVCSGRVVVALEQENVKALKCALTSHTVGVKCQDDWEQIKKR